MKDIETRAVNLTLISSDTADANGVDSNTITARLLNGSTLVSGATVSFMTTTEGATFSNGSQVITAVTNPLGECSVKLISKVTAVSVIASCFLGATYTAAVESKFTAPGTGEGQVYLQGYVLTDNAAANGKAKNTILYTLTKSGMPLANEYVSFSAISSSGKAVLTPEFGQSDADGHITLEITDSVVEAVLVQATATSSGATAEARVVTFSEALPEFVLTGNIVSNNAEANGKATNTVEFILKDNATGAVAPNHALTISGSEGLAVNPTLVMTDSDGKAVIACSTLLSGNQYNITAVMYTERSISCTVSGIKFVATEVLDSLADLVVVDYVEADGKAVCKISYILTKKKGRDIVAGQKIYIKHDSETAVVSESTLVTNERGVALLEISDTEGGAVKVVATTDYADISTTSTVNFKSVKRDYELLLSPTAPGYKYPANGMYHAVAIIAVIDRATGKYVAGQQIQLVTTNYTTAVLKEAIMISKDGIDYVWIKSESALEYHLFGVLPSDNDVKNTLYNLHFE